MVGFEPLFKFDCHLILYKNWWIMQENFILAYYAQIWKFGPGSPKMEFFKFFSFFVERSPDFATNEPSTTPGH